MSAGSPDPDIPDGSVAPAFEFHSPAVGPWRCAKIGPVTVWSAGDAQAEALGAALARDAVSARDPIEAAAGRLAAATGFFAVVLIHPAWFLCAVDRVRSLPLIWTRTGDGRTVVAQRAADLMAARGSADGEPTVDGDQSLALAMAGFTVGGGTLLQGVRALLPGEMLAVGPGDRQARSIGYRAYRPWRAPETAPDSDETAREELAAVLRCGLADTVAKADGRTIAVPLSAGLDSRLIAGGLRALGYDNVVCFAYGLPGNREQTASREIAQRLGYPWRFVPYSNGWMRTRFAARDYQAYLDYADSLTAVHFPQDFPAVCALLDIGFIPADAMVVNGQSGDFITGNHIPPALRAPGVRGVDAAIERLLAKHFTQWGHLRTDENRRRVAGLLRDEITALAGDVDADAQPAFALYEASEFVDRQSKYVVNGQRAYEHLGLDWDLPLWHGALIDFFERQPVARKAGQRLYRETLMALDWGGVWRDIPINATRVRPGWIRPVRAAFKAAHLPFGRSRWHRFERRFLAYFMAPLCGYAARGWMRVAKDARRPRAALAVHVEDYLNRHAVDIDALPGGGER